MPTIEPPPRAGSDTIARPFLLEADIASKTRAIALGGAVAVHVALGLALVLTFRTVSTPTPVAPTPEIINVALIELESPRAAATASPSAAEAPDAGTEAAAPATPTQFDVDIGSPPRTLLALPDILRLEDPAAADRAPGDAVRAALAQSLRCRSAGADDQSDCPAGSEEYAVLAEARDLDSSAFLDAAFAPREDGGPPQLKIGPVTATASIVPDPFGEGEAAIMIQFKITLPPRGDGADYAAPV